MKRTLVVVTLALTLGFAVQARAGRSEDRAHIQSLVGATGVQMDSLDLWYPGIDVVVDFSDRAKFYFAQYREQWEIKNGKDVVSQARIAELDSMLSSENQKLADAQLATLAATEQEVITRDSLSAEQGRVALLQETVRAIRDSLAADGTR